MGSTKFFVLILTILTLTFSAAAARLGTNILGKKTIVKTIKIEGGDIVDCIDMYQQPAFDHPLLAKHKLQVNPSTGSRSQGSTNGVQSGHKKEHRCPYGSIPIKRPYNSSHHFTKRNTPPAQNLGSNYHQHAVVQAITSAGTIHGIHATLNVWNPTVGPNDFSLSQLWLMAGNGPNLNTMEVGWQVYPGRTGDKQTRTFIYWTSDDYNTTGCYDLGCAGFVQTNGEFVIGGVLDVSTYGGQQSELEVSIKKDAQSGNWWLYVAGNAIGYWPKTLFKSLADAADYVEWGGEVFDSTGGGGQHTSNQMGSGHFPDEGLQKSSYIRGIKYTDTSGSENHPNTAQDFDTIVTLPSCYNLKMDLRDELYLFFGGPGCQ